MRNSPLVFPFLFALSLTACSGGASIPPGLPGGATPTPTGATPTPVPSATVTAIPGGKVGHVWLIVEENEEASSTFAAGASSLAPYLSFTLRNQGAYLQNYYATGHVSLDNYLAMAGGQPPSVQTTTDCMFGFNDFIGVLNASTGLFVGDGCVYPASVLSIGDQLNAEGISWRSYDEDMGNDATRDNTASTPFACGHPNPATPIGQTDPTQSEEGPSGSIPAGDAYATRHNPFMYFHSIIDVTSGANACANHVVNLQRNLASDLASVSTTPKFSFITPNLCDDGHDTNCAVTGAAGTTGGLPGLDAYLKNFLIPTIMGSPAYKQDGLIIVTFDEGATSDPSSCCAETDQAGLPAITGGGLVGAVLLSPYIKPGLTDNAAYNHFSLLRYLEDTLGVTHTTVNGTKYLGEAMNATPFNEADFNNPSGR